MDFNSFSLHPSLLEGIDAMNFKQPTPIQEQAIPIIMSGKDVIGIAQTGTGKTAAFILPILHRILNDPADGRTKALVIVPTRELALQIDQAVEAYSYFTGTSSVAIYGGGDGQDFYQEKQAIVQGVDIIIATPGRLISHMNVGYVDFSQLRYLILDEADRMLDMGFLPDLFRIFKTLNQDRQTLMFSATMPPEIERLASGFMRNPERITIAISKPAANVKQGAFILHPDQKLPVLYDFLKAEGRKDASIIIFCSRKQSVSALYQKLKSSGFKVGRISSDLEQEEREAVMQQFRNRSLPVLVATDVISRGIDIDGIDLVINFDVPREAEDYVHRIGRTARAQRSGEALTLVSPEEFQGFQRIERLIQQDIEKYSVDAKFGPTPAWRDGSQGHSKPKGKRKPFFKKRPKPQG